MDNKIEQVRYSVDVRWPLITNARVRHGQFLSPCAGPSPPAGGIAVAVPPERSCIETTQVCRALREAMMGGLIDWSIRFYLLPHAEEPGAVRSPDFVVGLVRSVRRSLSLQVGTVG